MQNFSPTPGFQQHRYSGYGDPATSPAIAPSPMAPQALAPIQAPATTTSPGDGHALGLAFLLTGVGSAIGLAYAGAFGAIAGGLGGGAVINGWQAYRYATKGTAVDDQEAIVSGTYGILGAAAAAYLFYKATEKKAQPNKSDELVGEE